MKNLPRLIRNGKTRKANNNEEMSKNKLVELMKFDNTGSAHIAKTRLESAGIHCMLAGEDSTGFQPILTSRTGGIRLLVMESDLEDAQAILAGDDPSDDGYLNNGSETGAWDADDDDEDDDENTDGFGRY